ncbi:MAG: hypothetical protein K5657_06060, partial [Desulfovibrio sp.]|nr:hypothetical protein [Desulfovibrio sp.]
ISMGMQSTVSHVLQVLERTHNPDNVIAAAEWIRATGLEFSLDLIFGTPGESLADWHSSLDAVLQQQPDHVSAYGLIVEEGTKLAAQIRRGVYPNTDPDDQADKYLATEQRLSAAGYRWYEISNWAYDPSNLDIHQSEHNLAYWRDQDWWGIGPGAHSHMAGVRWWNAKHPAAYASRVLENISPAIGHEIPNREERMLEQIMLGVRLAEGLDVSVLKDQEPTAADHELHHITYGRLNLVQLLHFFVRQIKIWYVRHIEIPVLSIRGFKHIGRRLGNIQVHVATDDNFSFTVPFGHGSAPEFWQPAMVSKIIKGIKSSFQ